MCKLTKYVIPSPSKYRVMLPALRYHIAQGDVKIYQFISVSSINVDFYNFFFVFSFFFLAPGVDFTKFLRVP